ncbi:eukaryotic membrane protein family-domain-containing protein [Coemansia mojavensis]|nr:eukaryotic membrane protein family-domain-containing protein [Coemansia mojavensis]
MTITLKGPRKRTSEDSKNTPVPAVYLDGSASLWDHYVAELESSDFDPNIHLKRQRVGQLLRVPWNVEKLLWFGVAICFDALLHVFAIMPARFTRAAFNRRVAVLGGRMRGGTAAQTEGGGASRWLSPAQLFDFYRGLLLAVTCVVLCGIDAAQMYHAIRAQSSLKLYFIFSALDIFDRLLATFGHDALDALQSTVTDALPQRWRSGAGYFAIAQGYMLLHTLVMFCQVITLNVAVNAYSDQLVSLLISVQFVEIKSTVFKKWEKEMLFQISCADIPPVSFAAATPSAFGPLVPTWLSGPMLNRILTPVLIVMGSELLIDWIKHSFVTKLNWIRPEIYSHYIDVLSRDLACSRSGASSRISSTRPHLFVDQSSRVARRLGLAPLPMACMVILMLRQVTHMISSSRTLDSVSNGMFSLMNGWVRWAMAGWSLLDIFGWLAIGLITYALLVWAKLAFSGRLMQFAWVRYREYERRTSAEPAANLKQFDDATKKPDRDDFMEPGCLINREPTEAEWEQQRPKWTMDNIERYSLFKSRIT